MRQEGASENFGKVTSQSTDFILGRKDTTSTEGSGNRTSYLVDCAPSPFVLALFNALSHLTLRQVNGLLVSEGLLWLFESSEIAG
jgi:hypothetical protein